MAGVRSRSIGKISSLPTSISKIKTSFDTFEKPWKVPAGPTTDKPGPTLFIVADTAVKLVVKSKPSRDITSNDARKIKMYATR